MNETFLSLPAISPQLRWVGIVTYPCDPIGGKRNETSGISLASDSAAEKLISHL
uniref:Alternative protein FUT2 n=1 Tax=Homo sapiens TaxID=9606 RepID=L8EC57_HUMAN|nr:alternative protein FUT2 [Homo sapiens]